MPTRHPLHRLDMHVSHACNLTCESCSHYSNHGHSGILSLEECVRQMSAWAPRLAPETFSVLGGEPTLNPHLTEIVEAAVTYFDRVEVNTNGLLLHRHPGLLAALKKSRSGGSLAITRHGDDVEYMRAFEPAVASARAACAEAGVAFSLWGVSERKPWTRRYLGHGPSMRPFTDGDPQSSYDNCWCNKCIQLQDGKLWKCPIVAYLPMQVEKFPEIATAWREGLEYQPLPIWASEGALSEFLGRKAEGVCGLCPAKPPAFVPASPLIPARELLRRESEKDVSSGG